MLSFNEGDFFLEAEGRDHAGIARSGEEAFKDCMGVFEFFLALSDRGVNLSLEKQDLFGLITSRVGCRFELMRQCEGRIDMLSASYESLQDVRISALRAGLFREFDGCAALTIGGALNRGIGRLRKERSDRLAYGVVAHSDLFG